MLVVKDIVSRAEQGFKPALPRLGAKDFAMLDGMRYYRGRPLAQFQELVDYVAGFFLNRFIVQHYRFALFGGSEAYQRAHEQRLSQVVQMSRTYWLNSRSAYAFDFLLPMMPVLQRRLSQREALSYMEKITGVVMEDFDTLLGHVADHEYQKAAVAGEGPLNLKHAIIPVHHPEAFDRGYTQTVRCVDYLTAELRRLGHMVLHYEQQKGQESVVVNMEAQRQRHQAKLKEDTVKAWMDVYPEALMRGMTCLEIFKRYGHVKRVASSQR